MWRIFTHKFPRQWDTELGVLTNQPAILWLFYLIETYKKVAVKKEWTIYQMPFLSIITITHSLRSETYLPKTYSNILASVHRSKLDSIATQEGSFWESSGLFCLLPCICSLGCLSVAGFSDRHQCRQHQAHHRYQVISSSGDAPRTFQFLQFSCPFPPLPIFFSPFCPSFFSSFSKNQMALNVSGENASI
jgi:hypothetical protein